MRKWLLQHPRLNPFLVYEVGLKRYLNSIQRVLPNFIIIGAQKSGTTSLCHYISQHPSVLGTLLEEINYFSWYFRDQCWYRANFATKSESKKIQNETGFFSTGETSPTYMSHPLVPFRIKKIIPNVKIIVILRNPIDRAFSHYQDSKRQKVESLTFEDALFSRNKQLEKEMENLKNKQFDGHFYERFSYIQRGIYSDALSLWFKVFPRNQFLILKTEDLENKLNDTMNDVFEFLKIPRFTINNSSRKNVGKYDQMKSSTRKSLIEFYKPHNKKLKELLKINFDWDK